MVSFKLCSFLLKSFFGIEVLTSPFSSSRLHLFWMPSPGFGNLPGCVCAECDTLDGLDTCGVCGVDAAMMSPVCGMSTSRNVLLG